ncbi:MAG TPA: hypothetical protein VKF32_13730 [Thermoanaerobaculia bacterium]|nr:hypothetical protein [Thermoanaerobaculia bacterium]
MDCGTARILIEALHDGELDVAGTAALRVHLANCCFCAVREDSVRRLKEFCRERRPQDRCPEELKRRLATRLAAAEARQKKSRWRFTLLS